MEADDDKTLYSGFLFEWWANTLNSDLKILVCGCVPARRKYGLKRKIIESLRVFQNFQAKSLETSE